MTSAPSSAWTSTIRPPSNRTSRPRDDAAVERERPSRANESLGAARVGGREDLLRRHVRDVRAGRRQSPTRRPASAIRAGGRRSGRCRGRGSAAHRRACRSGAPRAGRSSRHVRARRPPGRPRRAARRTRPPATAARCPAPRTSAVAQPVVRHADHRPVVQPLVDLARVLLGEVEHASPADAVAREVGEQIRLGIAGQRDDGCALVADLLRAPEQPRRCPREHLVRRHLRSGRGAGAGRRSRRRRSGRRPRRRLA